VLVVFFINIKTPLTLYKIFIKKTERKRCKNLYRQCIYNKEREKLEEPNQNFALKDI
jgi:hypothetical protein